MLVPYYKFFLKYNYKQSLEKSNKRENLTAEIKTTDGQRLYKETYKTQLSDTAKFYRLRSRGLLIPLMH